MNTVLIVEDEKLIRQGIKSMVMRSGVPVNTIIECTNGQMALDVLKEQEVDVMFTDIRMPKMDGITLVQEMQNIEQQPLTVVISGYDDFSYAVEMMRMGVREYILKPIDREQITNILHKLDKEIEKIEEERETKRHVGYQQLRYLCSADISEDEKEMICKRYSDSFFAGEYEVCCCNYNGEDYEQGNSYIYLKDVGDYDLFIVKSENKGFLLKNELRSCCVGFSKAVKGIESLREAYRQALVCRQNAFVTGTKVVEYEEGMAIEKDEIKNALLQEDIKQIESIVHILGTDRVKEAASLIQGFADKVQNGEMGVDEFNQRIHLFITRTAKNYENVLKVKEESVLELQDIYRYQTIKEYCETLTDWMMRFHDLISGEFDDYKNKQKIQQAVSFIHENYNKDLNMAVVSNRISMNYSLFSYAFKQYTGKNFVNFLKDLRMDEAKRLLEKTDMHVNEISQAVGYENEKHFMKTFKVCVGVSPTEYRKSVNINVTYS